MFRTGELLTSVNYFTKTTLCSDVTGLIKHAVFSPPIIHLTASGLNGFVIAILSLSKNSITNWIMSIMQLRSTYPSTRKLAFRCKLSWIGDTCWRKTANRKFRSLYVVAVDKYWSMYQQFLFVWNKLYFRDTLFVFLRRIMDQRGNS